MSDRGRALVTGASAGIGRALAREFARHGHDLVVVARREPRLDALAAELEDEPDVAVTVDARDLLGDGVPADLLSAHEVDVLVNNAGVGLAGRVGETDLEAELDLLDLNVRVPVELTHRFLEGRDDGGLLTVGSLAGFVPGPFLAGYYASKAHVNSYTQAVAAEQDAVDVTLVCPGPVETEFHDRAGMAHSGLADWILDDPGDVASAAYRGFRRGRTVVVPGLTGTALAVGIRLAPRALRRWGARRANRGR